MLRALSLLLVGEGLLLYGLFLAWPPLALVAAGVQVGGWAILSDSGDDA